MSKLTVKISYNDDLRRLSVDASTFTFAQLKETIKRLFTALDTDRVVVKYEDDEQDLVTVSTDEELLEAFNVSRNKNPPVLRLFLKDAVKPAQDCSSGCSTEEQQGCGRRGFGYGRPWWARRGCHAAAGQQQRRCPFFSQEQRPAEAVNLSDLPKSRRDDRHAHELILNPNPYGHGHFVCDGCQLAGQGASYQCAECSFDLHIDCSKAKDGANPWQRRQQWFRLHQEAMKFMETKSREGLEKAREFLKEQAGLSPFHRTTPLYNLACVEALLGEKLEKALEYLQEAVAAGWTDVEHIKKDTDLDALRGLEAYQALIASLEADSDDEAVHIEVNFPNREERRAAKQQAREEKRAAKFAQREEKREEKRVEKEGKREEKRQLKEEPKVVPLTPVYPSPAATTPLTSSPAPVIAVPSAPPAVATPAPASAPVPSPVPAPAPAAQGLSGSNSIDEFQTKLKTLEEMGFGDRRRNITALVLARGELVAAVQNLLSGQ